MIPTLKGRLESVAVGNYAALVRPLLVAKSLPITKRVVDDSKVTDHHAIIPTEETLRLGALTNEEKKLYDLIVRRFIALFYPAHRYDHLTLTIDIAGEHFHATGKVIKHMGWKEVYGQGSSSQGEDEAELDLPEQALPNLQKGDRLQVKQSQLKSSFTQPPARQTEANLLTQMEKHNLGTPATRADIIEKLLKSDTIERQGNRLHPTKKGLQLMELVVSELRSPELTAKWEMQLEQIAKGKGNMDVFLKGIRQQTIQIVKEVKISAIEYKPHNVTGSKCPDCGEFLQEFKGKKGKMLVCPERACNYRRSAEKQLSNKRCPQCKKKMEIRDGKAGKYFQCKPCNVIEMMKDQGNRKIDKRDSQKLVKQYSSDEGLTSSLGDALKAALEQNKED